MALYLNENGETMEDDERVTCVECAHFMVLHQPDGCHASLGDWKCPCSYREVPCGTP